MGFLNHRYILFLVFNRNQKYCSCKPISKFNRALLNSLHAYGDKCVPGIGKHLSAIDNKIKKEIYCNIICIKIYIDSGYNPDYLVDLGDILHSNVIPNVVNKITFEWRQSIRSSCISY